MVTLTVPNRLKIPTLHLARTSLHDTLYLADISTPTSAF